MSIRISLDAVECSLENERVLNIRSCIFTTGITFVVGKNGSGKSTLLKLLSTASKPDRGGVTYTRLVSDHQQGTYRKQLNAEDVRKMIGFLPQHFRGHSQMTVQRYLTYIAYHKGIPHQLVKSTLEQWIEDTGLFKSRHKKLCNLSGGQLQKVGLIQALINHPRICILDEPFVGLDNEEKLFFKRKIERLAFHSVVIISTHLVEEIDQLANNSLLFMEDGEISSFVGVDGIESILKRLER